MTLHPSGTKAIAVALAIIGFICILIGSVLSSQYGWAERGPWTDTIAPDHRWTWWPKVKEGDTFYFKASGSIFDVIVRDPTGRVIFEDSDVYDIKRSFKATVSGEYEVTIINHGTGYVYVEYGVYSRESYTGVAFGLIIIGILLLGIAAGLYYWPVVARSMEKEFRMYFPRCPLCKSMSEPQFKSRGWEYRAICTKCGAVWRLKFGPGTTLKWAKLESPGVTKAGIQWVGKELPPEFWLQMAVREEATEEST